MTDQSTNPPPDFDIPDWLKMIRSSVTQSASKGKYEVAIPICEQSMKKDLEIMLRLLKDAIVKEEKIPAVVSLNKLADISGKLFSYKDAEAKDAKK